MMMMMMSNDTSGSEDAPRGRTTHAGTRAGMKG